ncbi:MAG: heparinase II/III family protein [Clostridia bacterium]|nr:heparinase II/III family protein [Clostridia bacterium]
MVLFSQEELTRLRLKAQRGAPVLDRLREDCGRLLKSGIKVPKSGVATWSHYFACPQDAGRLEYSYEHERDFRCSVCGRIYNGEPYSGAWWRITNTINTYTAYNAALLWLLRGDEACRGLAEDIVSAYADNYPNYEEHGDIPYNKPGRMNSQIICEADCLDMLARAYDMLKESLKSETRAHIENEMLLPGAALLKKNRTDQLHNHEVIVNSALGVIGLVTGHCEYTDYAVNSKYGLIYQLEHGMLADGMWFENTTNYHFFALKAFLSFEKAARGTPYSLLGRPEYRRMYKMPLKLLQGNYSLPRLSDTGGRGMFAQLRDHYEFVYGVYGDQDFAAILAKIYETRERDSLDAFLYGRDEIQNSYLPLDDYHDEGGSGLTVLRGSDKSQYLLIRHGKYGGEHDHYDKLGLHYSCRGIEVLPDLGTVSYGAPPHYAYFKNTFTHNTVCINTQNQPPCNGTVARFLRNEEGTLIECRADWTRPCELPDSFVICQWDADAYRNVRFARSVLFTDEYFLDLFRVRGAAGRQADWIVHPKGKCESEGELAPLQLDGSAPVRYLKNARRLSREGVIQSVWRGEAGAFTLCSACSCPSEAIYAEGPDNPMDAELTYFIRRVGGAPDDFMFASVFRLSGDADLTDVSICFGAGCAEFDFVLDGKARRHRLSAGED